MFFLEEVTMVCDECEGRRYRAEVLEHRYKGKSIADVLQMTSTDASDFFESREIRRRLRVLSEVGLGYLELGQEVSSLSGGEAQRLKLVSELSTSGAGPTLYVMDEPTTGLHRQDVKRLLSVIQELVDRGDTVLVIEHHPDVIAASDWIVDLGPEGGAAGGSIVAQGTPEDVMAVSASHTGQMLLRERRAVAQAERAATA
jgi:excinuclease ABC subunit A